MAIQPAICSNCGGRIQVDDVDLNGFAECECCHTSHKIIDIITIDGLPTAKTHLINARRKMEDNNLDGAVEQFKKVLEIKPNCHEAYWGLFVCQNAFDRYYGYRDRFGNSGPFTKASMMQSALNKYAYRAIKYAPPDIAEDYRADIREMEDFVSRVRNGEFDQQTPNAEGGCGCYIATAVYGSYTCDEVMQLRRFRDEYLAKHALGRAFIRFYYAVSPAMARRIRQDSLTGRCIRRFLDWLRVRV